MLILERKIDERIRVTMGGIEVWIQIVEVRYGRVKVGIDAPREAVIQREEIIVETEGSNQAA